MIDITPYQERLQWLKEWVEGRIDGIISPPIWVDIDAIGFKLSIDQVLKIWNQTGVIYYRKDDVINHGAVPISFEEYCKYKSEI